MPNRSLGAAMGLGILAALFGCADTGQSATNPDTLFAKSVPASLGTETQALQTKVTVYLRNKHSIKSAKFYAEPQQTGWAQISLYVANEMKAVKPDTTGGPSGLERPEWHDPFDMIDLYPAKDNRPAFAVAMAKEPLPDGSKLVGYFALESGK
jgi:hypothetical protein